MRSRIRYHRNRDRNGNRNRNQSLQFFYEVWKRFVMFLFLFFLSFAFDHACPPITVLCVLSSSPRSLSLSFFTPSHSLRICICVFSLTRLLHFTRIARNPQSSILILIRIYIPISPCPSRSDYSTLVLFFYYVFSSSDCLSYPSYDPFLVPVFFAASFLVMFLFLCLGFLSSRFRSLCLLFLLD